MIQNKYKGFKIRVTPGSQGKVLRQGRAYQHRYI